MSEIKDRDRAERHQMKLTITNVGKVKRAEIRLDGLSVISGPNGSGKSTISRVLMTYVTCLRRMDELIRNRRIELFYNELIPLLKLSEMWMRRVWRYVRRSENPDEFLMPENWNSEEKIRKFLLSVCNKIPANQSFKEQIETLDIKVDSVLFALAKVTDMPDQMLAKEILEKSFTDAFGGQIVPLVGNTGPSRIEISFASSDQLSHVEFDATNALTSLSESKHQQIPPVIYIEPIHALDVNPPNGIFPYFTLGRYHANECDIGSILDNLNYSRTYGDSADEMLVNEVANELRFIVHGDFEEHDDHMTFNERFSETVSGFVELMNMASGSKTISVLVHALRNGALRRKSIVVIDEPEANLHPEWQVRFARALVVMRKRLELGTLINSHSPYFIKAIEHYADQEGVSDVGYYLMGKQGDDILFTADDCQGETNKIFETMYQPFKEIM